ncbi:superoxide dismutase [Stenotrophomonas sp. ESTM1D_MKCIP4_1]|uniref:superoxide dismutase family protein n=1 Tax=Stenotrophomonas sp. ESTM1D_MKCIP4_1 TaxID=2072414 RepID=UPI000D541C43|nr:superoxide dismutase family protein [Stenotrophomonas sp. ESTM1D_MKCIP4_1]AWH51819.1 superoxide dismutase [Stenotrophomonas sp. ESTM1D_MKCIP4_1]
MRLSFAILPLSAAVLLSACGSAPQKPQPTPPPAVTRPLVPLAEANLAPASASIVSGRLVLKTESGGVHLTGLVGGLQPMQQAGFHIHERGDCSAVDASSAGNHFNPTASTHGRAGNGKHHLGDIDNLQADAQGRANVDVHLKGVTLGGGAATDIVGRALVVHANADDYRSQPAGNAGVRIACGVIKVSR